MYNYSADNKDGNNNGNKRETDYVNIDYHGYGSCSCPRCGSTDINQSDKYCYKCGNRW